VKRVPALPSSGPVDRHLNRSIAWFRLFLYEISGRAFVHPYSVSAGAVAGCTDVTNAMVLAIESFLHTLYTDTRFLDLVQHAP
jgi:hypothetical protein